MKKQSQNKPNFLKAQMTASRAAAKRQRCGVFRAKGEFEPLVVAMRSGEQKYDDPVKFEIRQNVKSDYICAADYINFSHVDVVSVQHEFGLFGGDAGAYLSLLLNRLKAAASARYLMACGIPKSPSASSAARRTFSWSLSVISITAGAAETSPRVASERTINSCQSAGNDLDSFTKVSVVFLPFISDIILTCEVQKLIGIVSTDRNILSTLCCAGIARCYVKFG